MARPARDAVLAAGGAAVTLRAARSPQVRYARMAGSSNAAPAAPWITDQPALDAWVADADDGLLRLGRDEPPVAPDGATARFGQDAQSALWGIGSPAGSTLHQITLAVAPGA